MISAIKDLNPQRLYNHYNLGAYLMYKDILVFMDGRADMYTQDENKSFEDFTSLIANSFVYEPKNTIEDIFDKYDFDAFLCIKTEPLNLYFKYNDNYKIVFEDEISVLYTIK